MRQQLNYEKLRDMQMTASLKWDEIASRQSLVIDAMRERDALRNKLAGGYKRAISAAAVFMCEPFDEQEKATPEQLKKLHIDPAGFASYLAACRRVQRLQHQVNALRERHGPFVRLVNRLEHLAQEVRL